MEPELEVLEVAEKAVPCRQVTLVFLLHLELLILAEVVVAERHTGPEPLTMERPADPGSVLSAGDIKRRSR